MLVNDILDLTRLQAQKLRIEASSFSLMELIERALDLVSGAASGKGIELAYLMYDDIHAYLIQCVISCVHKCVRIVE